MASLYQGALALTSGVAAHVLYFNRGEHHMYGVRYVQAYLTLSFAGILFLHKAQEQTLHDASMTVALLGGLFLAGLYASLLTYRIFLSPLNKFPGPFGARISNFWLSLHIGMSSHALFKVQDLHKKYGPIVRVGSSDLSIADANFVNPIYGHGSKCMKASWYEGDSPLISMHTSRIKAVHDKRRRVWSPAFSDKALRGYETRIEPYAEALLQRLKDFKGGPVNVAKWFNFFGYDVMGDLAFGKDFQMLESGNEHFAINLLNEGMQPMALLLPTWFFRMITSIPGLAAGYWKFIGYCTQQLQNRIEMKPETPDIMSSLLSPFEGRQPKGLEFAYLEGDSRLLIVAGSDTTSATLVYTFYHLALNPSVASKARDEIKPLFSEDGSFDHREATHADYINGIINEALRLHPAVPSAIQRLTPPEGLTVGDTFIPGNTTVWCPQYTLGRSESSYRDPEKFLPERWSTRPELIKNKNAFFPFSLGPMGCIGKPLALMELRCVLAKLIMAFDVSLAPGEDGTDLIQKGRDHFTMETGPLNLVFKARSS